MPVRVLVPLLFAIVSAVLPAAAEAPNDVVHIGASSAPVSVRDKQLRIANERDGPLTLAQAESHPERFVTLLSREAPAGNVSFWLRFPLESDAANDERVAVFAGNWQHAEWIIVYPDGHMTDIRRGIFDPLTADQSPYATFLMRPHERVMVFAHISSFGPRLPIEYRVTLAHFDSFLDTSRLRLYLDGIVFGIPFALAVYSLVIFVSTRDGTYFWYSVYLIATATAFTGLEGMQTSHLRQFVLPGQPIAALILSRSANPIAWAALALFTRSFLHTRERFRFFDRALLGSVAIIAITQAIWVLDPATQFMNLFVWDAALLLCLAAAAYSYFRGYGAPYFVISMFIVTCGVVIASLDNLDINVLGFLPPTGLLGYFRTNSIVFVSTAIDALIFSLALADRFKRTSEEQKQLLEVQVRERTSELRQEKENSDTLLFNILPVSIAEELKETGASVPVRFDDASILFTDFKDFTTIAGSMPAARVVSELDQIFRAFDDIVETNGLEKIKTIGDAYMVAGGLPTASADHAQRCARAALAMIAYVAERNESASVKWHMRAGIHSGTVVAGVVGKRKFTYDVWGDSVNIAARVEASSEPDRLSVSAYTRELLVATFACEYRGKIELKGKGQIDIYAVTGELG